MAETIVMLDPHTLKVHPRNAEFFDDVSGAEFDRLVESIKDHGVLTPLRVTKDMTIVSGHQRMRAAIQAECNVVPVIFDESDDEDDVLMKLIETNFGRAKNDPIKRAKWIEEYARLRGVRQGRCGKRALKGNDSLVTMEDIAKELNVDVRTLENLKSLLKLDPALQTLISEGRINPTTGFKILNKLSPDEQKALLDKIPNDIKLSSPTIKAYIDQIREENAKNVNEAKQENDVLRGRIEELNRKNNELLAGNLPVSEAAQARISKLEDDTRSYYEQLKATQKDNETLRGICKENNDEIELYKSQLRAFKDAENGNDNTAVQLQCQIDELTKKLQVAETKVNGLQVIIDEKEDEINDLKRNVSEGYLRDALSPELGGKEYSARKMENFLSDMQISIGTFTASIKSLLVQKDMFDKIGSNILSELVEQSTNAVNVAKQLNVALMNVGGVNGDDSISNPEFANIA